MRGYEVKDTVALGQPVELPTLVVTQQYTKQLRRYLNVSPQLRQYIVYYVLERKKLVMKSK